MFSSKIIIKIQFITTEFQVFIFCLLEHQFSIKDKTENWYYFSLNLRRISVRRASDNNNIIINTPYITAK